MEDMGHRSSPSKSSTEHTTAPWSPPKRPAGRIKFKETRHPVFRGVRRRGGAGRWVCEVRVPGKPGLRLWLGTHLTAEAAARAHDAAMLALLSGRSAAASACLNFADSAWLLVVPPARSSDLADVRRAASEAVAGFQRREEAAVAAAVDLASGMCVSADAGMFEVPVALGMHAFELDLFAEMDLGTYYADLAEGLLMKPPAASRAWWGCDDAGADIALWS